MLPPKRAVAKWVLRHAYACCGQAAQHQRCEHLRGLHQTQAIEEILGRGCARPIHPSMMRHLSAIRLQGGNIATDRLHFCLAVFRDGRQRSTTNAGTPRFQRAYPSAIPALQSWKKDKLGSLGEPDVMHVCFAPGFLVDLLLSFGGGTQGGGGRGEVSSSILKSKRNQLSLAPVQLPLGIRGGPVPPELLHRAKTTPILS